MTPEQKAAYVFAQSVAAMAEIEAMKAANQMREMNGHTIAYGEEAFGPSVWFIALILSSI